MRIRGVGIYIFLLFLMMNTTMYLALYSGTYDPVTDEIVVRTENPTVRLHEELHRRLRIVLIIVPYLLLALMASFIFLPQKHIQIIYQFYIIIRGAAEITAYLLTGSLFPMIFYSFIVFLNLLMCYYLFIGNPEMLDKKLLELRGRETSLIPFIPLLLAVL